MVALYDKQKRLHHRLSEYRQTKKPRESLRSPETESELLVLDAKIKEAESDVRTLRIEHRQSSQALTKARAKAKRDASVSKPGKKAPATQSNQPASDDASSDLTPVEEVGRQLTVAKRRLPQGGGGTVKKSQTVPEKGKVGCFRTTFRGYQPMHTFLPLTSQDQVMKRPTSTSKSVNGVSQAWPRTRASSCINGDPPTDAGAPATPKEVGDQDLVVLPEDVNMDEVLASDGFSGVQGHNSHAEDEFKAAKVQASPMGKSLRCIVICCQADTGTEATQQLAPLSQTKSNNKAASHIQPSCDQNSSQIQEGTGSSPHLEGSEIGFVNERSPLNAESSTSPKLAAMANVSTRRSPSLPTAALGDKKNDEQRTTVEGDETGAGTSKTEETQEEPTIQGDSDQSDDEPDEKGKRQSHKGLKNGGNVSDFRDEETEKEALEAIDQFLTLPVPANFLPDTLRGYIQGHASRCPAAATTC
ncbi:hypothetical protein PM082_013320 [Marasmius tenuissimus]|nr:hypothetical protein PM082_013320 [Marasmius tenuissimus]